MKREQETFPYIAKLLNGAEVEWKPLGEVAKVNKGVQLNKTKLKDEGKYPAYNGGKTYSGWTDDFNVEENTTIISQGGASAGFVNFVTTKFWANAHCYYIIPNLEIVNNRYLYQFLKFQEKFFMNSQHGAGIPALATSKLNKHLIPIPPLSVQQEIVRILDKFTQLEAELKIELETELDCRKRQYEYYRDKLLSFNEVVGGGSRALIFSDLQWKTLGDLGAFYGGLTGKSKNDFSNGNAKFISYMNVFSNIATNFKVNDFVKIGESENQNTIQYGDILFTGSSESLEECGMSSVVNEEVKENVYLNSFCFGYRFHNSELFLPNFLKFLFRSEKIRKQIVKTANGVTRFNVSKKKMEKIQIPIPPIEEQERIAGILDKFDTLVNSISEGLPREIELRRKQYEYYREKLLSFPKN